MSGRRRRAGQRLQSIVDRYEEKLERQAILDRIRHFDGHYSRAMASLGLGRTTFYEKLEKYGMPLARQQNTTRPPRKLSRRELRPLAGTVKMMVASFEKKLIVDRLARCNGDFADAMKSLGVGRPWFYAKLKKHGIPFAREAKRITQRKLAKTALTAKRTDERKEAVRKLRAFTVLRHVARADRDPGVRQAAIDRILALTPRA